MKDISKLVVKLDKIQNNLVNNLAKTQQEVAWDIGFDVRKLAPKDTGRYADSIKVSNTEINGNKISTNIYTDAKVISSKNKTYNLGYLLEIGTSPHLILPVYAKKLHFLINGKDVYAKRVNHPGSKAQPHFQPSLNANKYKYKQKISETIRRTFNG